MQLGLLGLAFAVIIGLLMAKRPLWQAFVGGMLAVAVLFRMPFLEIVRRACGVLTNWDSLSILLSLYLITFLQRMLEARDQITLAQRDLDSLFHNRRVNAAVSSMFIGLLPSAAATILCGDMVKDAAGEYLDVDEQAFVTSWFRHIPETTLPTYSSVLLMAGLSGVPLPRFMLGMLVPIAVLLALGWLTSLRKLPSDPGTPKSANRALDARHLVQHLWAFLAILVFMLAFDVPVVAAVALVMAAAVFVYRFRPAELRPMVKNAFDRNLLLNTFLVLVFKEFIAFTGVLELLPGLLGRLPVPSYLVFALLFFVGGIISGMNAIIALGTPLAFAALPGGAPLMVLLMCMCHAASQLSPTHVCVVVAAEHFGIPLSRLIRRVLPVALAFCVLMVGYYNVLMLF